MHFLIVMQPTGALSLDPLGTGASFPLDIRAWGQNHFERVRPSNVRNKRHSHTGCQYAKGRSLISDVTRWNFFVTGIFSVRLPNELSSHLQEDIQIYPFTYL